MAQCFSDRGYNVISGGTDIHMFLVKLSDTDYPTELTYESLTRAHISINKIRSQADSRSPAVPNRLRIGSAAVTRRGFSKQECSFVANWICDILDDPTNDELVASVGKKVLELCRKYPVYSERSS